MKVVSRKYKVIESKASLSKKIALYFLLLHSTCSASPTSSLHFHFAGEAQGLFYN